MIIIILGFVQILAKMHLNVVWLYLENLFGIISLINILFLLKVQKMKTATTNTLTIFNAQKLCKLGIYAIQTQRKK